jgi:predicted dehydrogenase
MIRFGIVGAGSIARKFASDIAAVEGAVITAVASRSFDKANQFKTDFGIPYAFEGYHKMALSEHIDAVYIATPHNFHKEHSILFLTHKKHVLCEKPIAVNKEEFEDMIACAKDNDRLLMEAMWTRYLPAMRRLQDVLAQNDFGALTHMDVSFGFNIIEHATASSRLLNPQLAGGSLLDLGVYYASFFRFVTSDPIRSMQTSALMSKTNVDLMTAVDIVLDNDAKTTVHLESAMDRSLSNLATLEFEHGTIEIPNFWSTESIIINGEKEHYPHKIGGFEYEIQHFVDSIQEGLLEDPIMTHQESRDVMRLLDEIRASIKLKYPFE